MDRLLLQQTLEVLLGSDHVYFQPPASVKIVYPAIVYNLDGRDTKFADNAPYAGTWQYQLLFIAREPDSSILAKLVALPLCTLSNTYVADNLNHYVFSLYF
jgi:hypothetical protein